MKKLTDQVLNEQIDKRHKMNSVNPSALAAPDSVTFVRCKGCRKLLSEWEIRVYGPCPTCGGSTFNGAYPSQWEMVRVWLLNVTKHWVVWGPEGRKWNKNTKIGS